MDHVSGSDVIILKPRHRAHISDRQLSVLFFSSTVTPSVHNRDLNETKH